MFLKFYLILAKMNLFFFFGFIWLRHRSILSFNLIIYFFERVFITIKLYKYIHYFLSIFNIK